MRGVVARECGYLVGAAVARVVADCAVRVDVDEAGDEVRAVRVNAALNVKGAYLIGKRSKRPFL